MSQAPIDSLIAIAHEAGEAIQGARRRGLAAFEKSGGEIVTSADEASHDVLVRRFAEHFPGLPVLSEEGDRRDLGSGPILVADELDGTAPFCAGSKHWGIMLALIDREPTHGVIFLPDLDTMIAAEKGGGCRLNGRSIALNADVRMADVLLGTEINSALDSVDWKRVQSAAQAFRAVRCMASAAASTHELLTGVTHAYLNCRGGKIWDFAAVSLAVTEANGTAAAPDGRSLEWTSVQMGFMAASGWPLLRQLQGVLPGFASQPCNQPRAAAE